MHAGITRKIHSRPTLVAPLRVMLEAERWNWSGEQQKAFKNVKASIAEYSQLHHYTLFL